ncbi:thiol reductant ABC exporter subunit CydC [Aquabacter cavernae]|uniref:thiol reductant ABC exporter subunit CydC n=1 Tax=Aquabacter cavernae TaxID=2496029 RepID=UPI000F8D975D|nr:thiol reductant ABC exporter subunit CydC [Aquabacter cavernae]
MKGDFALLGRLLGLAGAQRGWMLLAGLAACVTILASFGLMAVAGWFIASMAIAGVTTGMMNYFLPAAGIRFFAILRTGGRYLDRILSHEAVFRVVAHLRLWLFRRLIPLSPGQLQDRRGADLASSLQADIDTLQHAFLRLGTPLAVSLVCAVAIIAVLSLLHPPAAVVVAGLLLCAGGLVPALTRRAAARPSAETVHLRAELRVALVDLVQGAPDLRAAGAGGRQLAAIDGISGRLLEAQRRAAAYGALAEAAFGLCASLALWGVAVLAIAGVTAGALAPAMAPALTLAALASFEAVATLPAAVQRWGEVMAAARRMFALADTPPDVTSPVAPSPVPDDFSLRFSAVRLRYGPAAPFALDGLDLHIPSGRRIAILGPSGAGKSSIGRLLLRFWEYDGDIRLGGHDLRLYRPEDLRALVGVAAQETHLFNSSIRANLLMAAPEADEAAMARALDAALLSDVVARLPDGLDTFVGEGGTRLSAGEARRLVLARALVREPRILVLDEPTENLDATTARRLLASLAMATHGRTTLLITHDPAAAQAFADEIVRLEAGVLVTPG